MSAHQESRNSGQPMSWEEKQLRYAALAHELGGYADEMVALLEAHGEVNWTRIYARFGRDIRQAQTDKSRLKAIEAIESIYGGMGSWNDFYLTALGEAEELRGCLSCAISRGCGEFIELIEQPPREPRRGLWQGIVDLFTG